MSAARVAAARVALARVAAAPISWGVCEVPGWGYQLSRERVLAEMHDLGFPATELGPEGFIGNEPAPAAALLAAYDLRAVAAFVPVVLHDAGQDPLGSTQAAFDELVGVGAEVAVLAAATGLAGYDRRPQLDAQAWATLLGNLDRLTARGAARGLTVALHPHVGTMIERPDEVQRVLEGSAAALCVDTGHLLIGGADPLAVVKAAPERVAHVHLKDVDAALAARVRGGELSYSEAVTRGLYRALGDGDLDLSGLLSQLRQVGYTGWYVLEQDTVLDAEPLPGAGPILDVTRSLEFLTSVLHD